MKNTKTLELQLTQTNITFCYGEKAYSKYIKKNYGLIEYINSSARTTSFSKHNKFDIVIGVIQEKDNIYGLKALVVHELSHAVTMIMNEYGFNCDEFRSYTIQFLYQEIMPFIDDLIVDDSIKCVRLKNSTELIEQENKRLSELEKLNYDKKSFNAGFIEGYGFAVSDD